MVSEAMQGMNISFLAEGGSLSTGVVLHILLLGPIPEGPYLVKIFCSHVVLYLNLVFKKSQNLYWFFMEPSFVGKVKVGKRRTN